MGNGGFWHTQDYPWSCDTHTHMHISELQQKSPMCTTVCLRMSKEDVCRTTMTSTCCLGRPTSVQSDELGLNTCSYTATSSTQTQFHTHSCASIFVITFRVLMHPTAPYLNRNHHNWTSDPGLYPNLNPILSSHNTCEVRGSATVSSFYIWNAHFSPAYHAGVNLNTCRQQSKFTRLNMKTSL